MAKRGKDKKRLEQVENDIKNWKEQGYKIPELERLVEFIKTHKTSSITKKILHIGLISFLLAVIIILASFPYVLATGTEYAESLDKYSGIVIYKGGYPLNWLSIQYKVTNGLDIDTMSISSMSNFFINFIFFLVCIFICLSGTYFVYSKIVSLIIRLG